MTMKKITAHIFRQPRYYNSFSCTGGQCPMSCCLVWRVDWTKEEMDKLRNAECSEELRHLINSSFEDNGEKYTIKMDDKNRCPFLTEDNFCGIHQELGEKYLSQACSFYPRNVMMYGNTVLNYCNLSCYNVMDVLCSDKDCMTLENYIPEGKNYRMARRDSKAELTKHPELRYSYQLFEMFYDIISDDSHSLETSVVLGALAAQIITRMIEAGEYDSIPEYINDVEKQIGNAEQIERLEKFESKTNVRLEFALRLDQMTIRTNLYENIMKNGQISVEKFLEGEKRFNEAYADKPFVLRNIALNLMLELKMPFQNKNATLFENYCYFAAALSVIKFVAAASYAKNEDSDIRFKSISAYVSRSFAHNDVTFGYVMQLLNMFRCTSPAFLAMIVK